MKKHWMVGITALAAMAGTASATPVRLDYCVTGLGGGQFRYVFTLTLDNNDNSWAAGQGFGWIIFGDANSGTSPLNDFVGDTSTLPAGPFTQFQGTGGGHNRPPLGPVSWPPPHYPPTLSVPAAVGDQITRGGTASEDLPQGQMLW